MRNNQNQGHKPQCHMPQREKSSCGLWRGTFGVLKIDRLADFPGLVGSQKAPLARREMPELQGAEGIAIEHQDIVIKPLEYPPDLALLPLAKLHHDDPRRDRANIF